MDIGDIIRLIFFGLLFFSFFGRGFVRRNTGEQAEGEQQAPRPTDISQSGGEPQRPRPTPVVAQRPMSDPVPAAHEQQWEDGTFVNPERHKEEVRQRYGRTNVETYDDARKIEEQQEAAARRAEKQRIDAIMAREDALESGPSAGSQVTGDITRRRPRRAVVRTQRRHPATGGEVLRGSLRDADTLERAFIVKEVLDVPLGLRKSS